MIGSGLVRCHAPSAPASTVLTRPGDENRTRTISLGMSAGDRPDQSRHRSACTLAAPPVTVKHHVRPMHRARSGHADTESAGADSLLRRSSRVLPPPMAVQLGWCVTGPSVPVMRPPWRARSGTDVAWHRSVARSLRLEATAASRVSGWPGASILHEDCALGQCRLTLLPAGRRSCL